MKRKINRPVKSADVPATSGMLYHMEDRLGHRIGSLDHRMEAMDHRMEAMGHRLESKIDDLKSEVHRIALLVEEQNARNKFVMDGYTQMYELVAAKLGS